MIACRSLFRFDRVLKFKNSYVGLKPENCFQAQSDYHGLSYNFNMGSRKEKGSAADQDKKRKIINPVWRPVRTQANSSEGISESTLSSRTSPHKVESKLLQGDLSLSTEKHSSSIEVGASLFQFIKGKGGSTQKKIEDDMGVKIIFPTSEKEDFVTIEGTSIDSMTRASEKIQAIIDKAVKSPNPNYSHFISLPLAIHPDIVDKLFSFQSSILGNSEFCLNENAERDSNEDTAGNEEEGQLSKNEPNVAVELKVDRESVKVNIIDIPVHIDTLPYLLDLEHAPLHFLCYLGIEKSIFINPRTFHLTVLMLKLWNKDQVNAAAEVLQSISSRVMDALDNRPVFVRLKGLDCMRGSLAKACVLYAPVEEIGSEDRLLRACQVIIDTYVEAGLVLEKDAKQKLKLHATVMNVRHRKRKKRTRNVDSFDARGIFRQYGSQEWGDYLIREAHLSQRFVFDENGYYHCCAQIPFPENMQVD